VPNLCQGFPAQPFESPSIAQCGGAIYVKDKVIACYAKERSFPSCRLVGAWKAAVESMRPTKLERAKLGHTHLRSNWHANREINSAHQTDPAAVPSGLIYAKRRYCSKYNSNAFLSIGFEI
jgi:hypothetical protein